MRRWLARAAACLRDPAPRRRTWVAGSVLVLAAFVIGVVLTEPDTGSAPTFTKEPTGEPIGQDGVGGG